MEKVFIWVNEYFHTNFIEKKLVWKYRNNKKPESEIIMNIRIIITGTTNVYSGEYPVYGFWNSPKEFFHKLVLIFLKRFIIRTGRFFRINQ